MVFIVCFIITIALLTFYKIKKAPSIKKWKINLILSGIVSIINSIIINLILQFNTYLILKKESEYFNTDNINVLDTEMIISILKQAGILFIGLFILYFISLLIIDLILSIVNKNKIKTAK